MIVGSDISEALYHRWRLSSSRKCGKQYTKFSLLPALLIPSSGGGRVTGYTLFTRPTLCSLRVVCAQHCRWLFGTLTLLWNAIFLLGLMSGSDKVANNSQPRPAAASSLNLWWLDQINNKPKEAARSMNAIINLVCWSLWKERNTRVFNNLLSPPSVVFSKVVEEATVWLAAGKSKAGQLARRPLEPD